MGLKEIVLRYRRSIIIATHLALVVCAYILAFYLRLDFKIGWSYWLVIIKTLPVLVAIKMVVLGFA